MSQACAYLVDVQGLIAIDVILFQHLSNPVLHLACGSALFSG